MRKLWLLVVLMTAVAVPSKASAEELTLTGMGLREIVTVNSTLPGFENGSFYAGQFLWDWSQSPYPDGFGASIVTYCVDILHDVQNPQDVMIDTTDFMPSVAQGGGGKAAWLLNTFAPVVTTGIQAAALQVAIWESIYDNDADVTSGVFSIVTDNTALTGAFTAQLIAAQATTYLDQLFYAPGQYHTSTATWLNALTEDGTGQSQITTPEPASLMLVGFGAALAGLRRRRLQATRG